ncbi:MAG: glutamate--tRNA ligase [Chloroflexi bacterium]|nr:MAG: glutamate--tRNA ligase [Chloroflexota bacterium]
MVPNRPVRVRFAPSPTGYLHIGGARTALFNWLFARRYGGAFILRIEDTDRTRYQPDSLQDILDGLRWLGLDWDEGPEVGGEYGPYFQSQRLELYQKWGHWLVEQGHAYRCYCSPERLAAMRQEQRRRGEPPRYDRRCRFLTAQQRAEHEAAGDPYVIRLAVPLEGSTTFRDLIRGEITFQHAELDDLILLKSDGWPTYHLANVVDDHFMEISHIMRGDEWLPSVPKHVLLYRAFGWEPPAFAHLPVILNPSGKGKLSKRKSRLPGGQELLVFVHELREAGYLPEAVFNFLARVGWSMDAETEVFSREEAIAHFSIEAIHPSPAALPYSKLDWLNGLYIRRLPPDDLARRLLPVLRQAGLEADPETVQALVPLIQERIKRLNDAVPLVDFFFQEPLAGYDPALLTADKTTPEQSLTILRRARQVLAALPTFDEASVEQALRALVPEMGLKARQVFGVLRVAVTGKRVSPPLFGSIALLGRERVLRRLTEAEVLLTEERHGEPTG